MNDAVCVKRLVELDGDKTRVDISKVTVAIGCNASCSGSETLLPSPSSGRRTPADAENVFYEAFFVIKLCSFTASVETTKPIG